jgi:hypothetical protein
MKVNVESIHIPPPRQFGRSLVNRQCIQEAQLLVTDESSSPFFTWQRRHLVFPTWQRDYEAVYGETDKTALFKKVEIAETAMLIRRDLLTCSVDNRAEWQALEASLAELHVLKKERLNF